VSIGDAASRRKALALLGGSGLAALVSRVPEDAAAAKKNKAKKKDTKHKQSHPDAPPPHPIPRPTPAQLVSTFPLSRSIGAINGNCLAEASGTVRVFELGFAEQMEVTIQGLPANTEFDLFIIQQPDNPFGVSWYQGDLTTDDHGSVTESFVGRFNSETFVVSPGAVAPPQVHPTDATAGIQTNPIHTYHVGVWFDSPDDAQAAGCPPTVTPFNGDHTAGIQALSTRDFPPDHGPLRDISS
jgi:hypothetical protein